MLKFPKIEVVSQLKPESIYPTVKNYSTNYNQLFIVDKIHHLVNKYCSAYNVHQIAIDKFEQMD